MVRLAPPESVSGLSGFPESRSRTSCFGFTQMVCADAGVVGFTPQTYPQTSAVLAAGSVLQEELALSGFMFTTNWELRWKSLLPAKYLQGYDAFCDLLVNPDGGSNYRKKRFYSF